MIDHAHHSAHQHARHHAKKKLLLVLGLIVLAGVLVAAAVVPKTTPVVHPVVALSSPDSAVPETKTVSGTYACLPDAATTGPATTECALGIEEGATGKYYALDTSNLAGTTLRTLPTGTGLSVTGLLTPSSMLAKNNSLQKYAIVGVIAVSSYQLSQTN